MLGLLSSPIIRGVAIAAAVATAIGWLRHDAASDAREQAEAECLQRGVDAQEEERRRQEGANRVAVERAQERAREAETRSRELEEEVHAIAKEVSDAGGGCVVPDDLRERLLRIR